MAGQARSIDDLPGEVVENILRQLDLASLAAVAQLNDRYRQEAAHSLKQFSAQRQAAQLVTALMRHDTEAVRLLLAVRRIDVNQMDYNGASALLWAVSDDHPAILQTLLQAKGIQINLSDTNLRTPLIRLR